MLYRTFPKLPDLPLSTLGFGCMRLPTVAGHPSRVDETAATALLHAAIDAGVNLVDTAAPYHGGQSERILGRALAGGYRERVRLATKLPTWQVEAERDWERLLDEQLARLQTSRIDLYMLHALSAERWDTVTRLRGLPAMERALADGRIGHLGFSFHGSLDAFRTIVDGYDWDFCLMQLNYVDVAYQAGLEGLRHAAARRVGVLVMEPLRGGALARPPAAVAEILARPGRRWSPAEWALRFLFDRPEVTSVLSGMNAAAQLAENLAVAIAAGPGSLGAGDHAALDAARACLAAKTRVPCTTCGYCLPCPHDVSIPDVLSLYNAAAMFDGRDGPAAVYRAIFVNDGAGAAECTECGECEPKCPQGIPITEKLKEAHAHLLGT